MIGTPLDLLVPAAEKQLQQLRDENVGLKRQLDSVSKIADQGFSLEKLSPIDSRVILRVEHGSDTWCLLQ